MDSARGEGPMNLLASVNCVDRKSAQLAFLSTTEYFVPRYDPAVVNVDW